ncbi:FAD-dependent monooxygenase [Bordetella bronchiseptica]|uniref:FAD-dependent monooxygenase n=1 Tax=Bordetella bronchiseptica TaxID=518 RepID=UPI000461FBE2|nr:FAD-dependent monooxygenase [Bordetella bronchiseptica]KDC34174.1 putative 3-hydroxybenzoate 6-monooxygenase [Bordetella bronchiseptica M435/02/3]
MPDTSSPRILIAGAGLGGLTAALALQARGFQVRVLEQAAQLRELGAGIQLSANANRVLYRLGLGAALGQVASPASGKRIRLWNTGQTWPLFDLGAQSVERYGYPYLTIYRADLHRVLAEAVLARDPQAIELGARVESVAQDDAAASVTLADGSTRQADILVGADGVHSRVRAALHGQDQARFSGALAWRGVIPAHKLPPHLREPYAVNWVGPGAHVIHYPLRRGELVNFVGILERDDWQVESWTQQGTIAECARDFAGWHEDVQTLIHALDTPFKWAMMLREPLARWTSGRITLLGDACHPTLPMLASGAAMAIEDGYVLARCLDGMRADARQALVRYQDLRVERTARVVRGSAENARRFHNPELAHAAGAAAYVEQQWSEARVRERYEWLFTYDVDAEPV